MPEPLDLAPIRAREQAATPGEWKAIEAVTAADAVTFHDIDQAMWWIDQPGWLDTDEAGYATRADAEFIANARADIPALLAEVERLRDFEAAVRALKALDAARGGDRADG